MFERDRYGAPLVAHIAGGVAIGGIVAGVVLYGLWTAHMRMQVAEADRQFRSALAAASQASKSTYRTPQPVMRAASSSVSPCAPGQAVGVLNGDSVCVSPSGQVTPIRR